MGNAPYWAKRCCEGSNMVVMSPKIEVDDDAEEPPHPTKKKTTFFIQEDGPERPKKVRDASLSIQKEVHLNLDENQSGPRYSAMPNPPMPNPPSISPYQGYDQRPSTFGELQYRESTQYRTDSQYGTAPGIQFLRPTEIKPPPQFSFSPTVFFNDRPSVNEPGRPTINDSNRITVSSKGRVPLRTSSPYVPTRGPALPKLSKLYSFNDDY